MNVVIEFAWPGAVADRDELLRSWLERCSGPGLVPSGLARSDLLLGFERLSGRSPSSGVNGCAGEEFLARVGKVIESGRFLSASVQASVESEVRYISSLLKLPDGEVPLGVLGVKGGDVSGRDAADAVTELLVWLCSVTEVFFGGAVGVGTREPNSYELAVGPALRQRGIERLRDYSWQVVLPPSRLALVDVDALSAFADRFEVVETPSGSVAGVGRIRVDERRVSEADWREWRRLLMPALVPRVREPRQPSPRPAYIVEEDWGTMTREELLEALTPRRRPSPDPGPEGGAGDG